MRILATVLMFMFWVGSLAAAPRPIPLPRPAPSAPLSQGVEDVNHIVAIVDDDVIVRSELEASKRTILAQLRQQNTPLPPTDVLERQLLERLILQRLQLQLANRSSIKVDDETLNSAVNSIAERNQVSLANFRQILAKDGYDFERFREDIRNQLIIGRLQQREVANHITVTDQEVDDFIASARSQAGESVTEEGAWRLGQILIALPEGASPESIQTARAKAQSVLENLQGGADFATVAMRSSNSRDALEGGDLGWRRAGQIPSLFAETVTRMKKGQLAGPIRSPAGFHIIKVLDYRNEAQARITQTRARHILIRTGESVSDEDAKNRLEQLRVRIQGGDDFGELARAHSEDTASAANQGNLGWVNPGDLVAEFEKVMDSLPVNQVSTPFKTPFGWHILQVQERRQQDSGSETLRSRAMEAIRSRKTEEEQESWLRRLREEAYVELRLDTEGG